MNTRISLDNQTRSLPFSFEPLFCFTESCRCRIRIELFVELFTCGEGGSADAL